MHILPSGFRAKLENMGLEPAPTAEEIALWDVEKKAVVRRGRYLAAAKAAVVVAIAAGLKFARHPDMSTEKIVVALGGGVVVFVAMFGAFLLQAGNETNLQKVQFIRARRMHRAILEEPDLEPEQGSG